MEVIHLWWIGEGSAPEKLLGHVCAHLERALALRASVWSGSERPREAYDPRRRQWSSSRILEWLSRVGPIGRVLGITDVDLFIPILTFVFGEAQLGGRAALVSTARLAEPGLPDKRIVLERLAKESVHEAGHLFGLLHCDTPVCVMGRSSSVRDVDKKRGELCSSCRTRLARASGEQT